MKNRYTGKIDVVRAYFDYVSYRFYNKLTELYKRFEWNKDTSPLPTKDPRDNNMPEGMQH